ncbi:hypothetical protein GPLA_1833 [Paraglaciecola polaris LMG 21857]|uniref:Uncharacterized protein n=1 Tax=Paraglaciecola polaris LMG 21857 TaxID=1129793 RepID=K7ABJ1_9ALTE|nr:hypothetical protein GPLA_1833 [Paraglaciecola polaris LMG 21857]
MWIDPIHSENQHAKPTIYLVSVLPVTIASLMASLMAFAEGVARA